MNIDPSKNEKELVLTVLEAAAALKVCPKTIYRLIARDRLKACKDLRHLRISRASLEAMLN